MQSRVHEPNAKTKKLKHLSIECRQTNTLVTVTSSQIKEISASQLELEVKQEHCLRRGKTQVNKSRVVLVLPLIGRKGKVVFFRTITVRSEGNHCNRE